MTVGEIGIGRGSLLPAIPTILTGMPGLEMFMTVVREIRGYLLIQTMDISMCTIFIIG